MEHKRAPHILLAEDYENVRQMTELLLIDKLGAGVSTYVDGFDLLESYEHMLVTDRHVDMIITDKDMPRMNGLELMAALPKIHGKGCSKTPNLPPVILYSGRLDQSDMDPKRGFTDYIRKPTTDFGMLKQYLTSPDFSWNQ